ncbi:retrovirus-related Pol polyprotein from transposon 412 [Trichonephila clavipes]|nr:retrovirus-related Pol polyprotein from transposon 412 [Trichonephila clavipes]
MFAKRLNTADFLSSLTKNIQKSLKLKMTSQYSDVQIEALPVTSKELRQETSKDIELGPLLRALRKVKIQQGREAQYTIEDGCSMYGLKGLYSKEISEGRSGRITCYGHLGIVKMKAIARSFVY